LQGQVERSFVFRVQKNSQVTTKLTSTSPVSMPFETYDLHFFTWPKKKNVEFFLKNENLLAKSILKHQEKRAILAYEDEEFN
jgi:hypothetical protein